MSDFSDSFNIAFSRARRAFEDKSLQEALEQVEQALTYELQIFSVMPAEQRREYRDFAAYQANCSAAGSLKKQIEMALIAEKAGPPDDAAHEPAPADEPFDFAQDFAMSGELDRLLPVLQDPDPEARIKGVVEILKLKDPDSLAILQDMIDLDASVKVRYFAKKALDSLRSSLNIQGAEALATAEYLKSLNTAEVVELLASDKMSERKLGMMITREFKLSGLVPNLFLLLQQEADPTMRAGVVRIVGELADEFAIPELARYLDDPNFRVRANTIEALELIGHFTIYPYILKKLQEEKEDNRIRANAAKVLKNTGGAKVLPILRQMITSDQPWQQDSAIYALRFMAYNDNVRELLNIAAKSPDPAVCEKAVALLEKHETPSASIVSECDAILADLESPVESRRLAAAQKAEQFMIPSIVDALSACLSREKSAKVKATIILTLGKIGDSKLILLLQKFLADPDARVRANTVQSLGMMDDKSVYPFLYGSLKDSNNRVKANAIIALKDDSYLQITRPLKEMIDSADPMMRRSAHFCISIIAGEQCVELLEPLLNDTDTVLKNRVVDTLMFMRQSGSLAAKAILSRHGLFDVTDARPEDQIEEILSPEEIAKKCRFKNPDDLSVEALREVSMDQLAYVDHWDLDIVSQENIQGRKSFNNFVQGFLSSRKQACLVLGTMGIGKTTHAHHFCKTLLEHGNPAFFLPCDWLQMADLIQILNRELSIGFSGGFKTMLAAMSAQIKDETQIVLVLDGVERIERLDHFFGQLSDLLQTLSAYPCCKVILTWNAEHFRIYEESSSAPVDFTMFYTVAKEQAGGQARQEQCFEIAQFAEDEAIAQYEALAGQRGFNVASRSTELSKYAKALFRYPLYLRLALQGYAGERVPYVISRRAVLERYLFFSPDDTDLKKRRREFLVGLAARMYRDRVCEIPRDTLSKDAELGACILDRNDQTSIYAYFLKRQILVNRRGRVAFAHPEFLGFLLAESLRPTLVAAGEDLARAFPRFAEFAATALSFYPVLYAIEIFFDDEQANASLDMLKLAVEQGFSGALFQILRKKILELGAQRSPLLLEDLLTTLNGQRSGQDLLLDVLVQLESEGQFWSSLELGRAMLQSADRDGNTALQQILCLILGRNMRKTRVMQQEAMVYLQRCLDLPDAGLVDRGSVHRQMAMIHSSRSEYEQAVACYDKAIAEIKNAGNHQALIGLLLEKGLECQIKGVVSVATVSYQEALSLSRKLKNLEAEVRALYRLGSIYDDQKNYPAALDTFEKSRALGEACRMWSSVVNAMNRVGVICRVHNELDKALSTFLKAKALAERHCEERVLLPVLDNLAQLYKMRGEFEKAKDVLHVHRDV